MSEGNAAIGRGLGLRLGVVRVGVRVKISLHEPVGGVGAWKYRVAH